MSAIGLTVNLVVNGVVSPVTCGSFIPIEVMVNESVGVVANVTGGNGSGITYRWKRNGSQISTASSITVSTLVISSSAYELTVSNTNGQGVSQTCTFSLNVIAASSDIDVSFNGMIDGVEYPRILCGTVHTVNRDDSVSLGSYVFGGNGSGYLYQWDVDGINTVSSSGTTVNTSTTGTYVYTLTVRNANGLGSVMSCSMTFIIQYVPVLTLLINALVNGIDNPNLISGTSFQVNQGDAVTLIADPNAGNGSGVLFSWTVGGVEISTSPSITVDTTVSGTFPYVATVRNVNNLGLIVIGNISLDIIQQPALALNIGLSIGGKFCQYVDCGSVKSVCKCTDLILTANPSGGNGSGYLYQWSVDGSLDGPTTQSISTTTNVVGSFQYQVILSNADGTGRPVACTITINVECKPCKLKTAVKVCGKCVDDILYCGECLTVPGCEKYRLSALVCGGIAPYKYSWKYDCCEISNCESIIITRPGKYSVTVTDSCCMSDTTKISLSFCRPGQYVPNPCKPKRKWSCKPCPDPCADPCGSDCGSDCTPDCDNCESDCDNWCDPCADPCANDCNDCYDDCVNDCVNDCADPCDSGCGEGCGCTECTGGYNPYGSYGSYNPYAAYQQYPVTFPSVVQTYPMSNRNKKFGRIGYPMQ